MLSVTLIADRCNSLIPIDPSWIAVIAIDADGIETESMQLKEHPIHH